MTRRQVPEGWIILGVSSWLAAAGNWPLWRELHVLGLLEKPAGWALGAVAGGMVLLLLTALLGMLAWPRVLRPAAALLLVAAAAGAHFMGSYGVVIDKGMLLNVLQTDRHEAADLVGPAFALSAGLLAGVPLLLLARCRSRPVGWRAAARRNLGIVAGSLALVVLLALAGFQPLASAMRNHKHLRYMVNPLNTVYALGALAARPLRQVPQPLLATGLDAHVPPRGDRPPLLLLVVGETGRSDHFALNGYGRDTTPELRREGVASFRDAWSCGTSTAASLPCMFSPLGRATFEARTRDTEGLLDVLQHAGMAVLWIDNQSGCKGVCDRVPSVHLARAQDPALCAGGQCLDGILLQGLDRRLAEMPAQQRARGVVLVLHQIGSHGPAYHARSPAAFKRFQPECTAANLQECSRQEVVNAYDNSIAYTDHVLASAIRWLRAVEPQWDTGLLYVSDHGESLGENNLYLHGLPYGIAPDVQKHVPWITWLSTGLQARTGVELECLRQGEVRLTHDHLFHSVLGLMQVETSAYRVSQDAYARCAGRNAPVLP
ncbi:phosphoethanolamine transferase [Ramlibacter pallidus]|uniref:Phosphoethanolamine--lipid A transferase n=1 Tax=Ramlibacter pallidus TaxID=2780087 RepID=A0ABR9RZN6_9BURK|nr:phosphoethanolamine--lipid A transferase [Ramlibacter pallidus]MBE7366710.1 phosphoethanolamine--lipid A transferase [Ramlibacter pallidus]